MLRLLACDPKIFEQWDWLCINENLSWEVGTDK